MTHRTLLVAGAITAAVALTACSDSTGPNGNLAGAGSFSRSGTLHVEKECGSYGGHARDICTITSSTLKEIPKGTIVIYASDAVGVLVDTDVRLDLPGPGNNTAFGHCTLSLATGLGRCVFSGGTGKFTWFHADVAVTPLGGVNFAWDGTYRYSLQD